MNERDIHRGTTGVACFAIHMLAFAAFCLTRSDAAAAAALVFGVAAVVLWPRREQTAEQHTEDQ